MINVLIQKHNQKIVYVEVKGHANSDEYGKDLVCAGVSTVVTGIANSLCLHDFLSHGDIQLDEGYAKIEVNESNEQIQLILETLETCLDTIHESYKKYTNISKMEV